MDYPKWIYHKDKKPCIVADEKAHKEMGAGWLETPAQMDKEKEEVEAKAPVKKILSKKKAKA